MRLTAYLIIGLGLAGIISCSSLKKTEKTPGNTDKLELKDPEADSTEYEVIIFDPGFEPWFHKHRKQPWYHTQESLETRNWLYVIAWNQKVRDGTFQMTHPNNPFEQEIDYRKNIDYGMEVNYMLYYYFKYIEDTWGKFR
jgi:hypothetical protein